MPNAKDYRKGTGTKILSIGSTGSGKTSGFITLPGKKFLYIFDPSALETLRGHDVDYEIFQPDILNMNVVALKQGTGDIKGKADEPKQYIQWEAHFETKLRENFFDQYDVIGIDSMTTFSDAVMDRVLWLNKRLGKWPEQADWTACMNTINNIVRTLTGIQGKTIYVTAHVEMQKDEMTAKIRNQIMLIGRLRNKLPLLFSEVWLHYGDTDAQKQKKYYVQTVQDRENPFIRCTLKGLDPVEDVTIDWTKPIIGQGIAQLLEKGK